MSIEAALRSLNFFAVQDNLSALHDRLQRMAHAARDPKASDRFEYLPSFIPAAAGGKSSGPQLLVDIGGTSTKVAARIGDRGAPSESWRVLFEDRNDSFNNAQSSAMSVFDRFAHSVATRSRDLLRDDVSTPRWALGIVWSNAMTNRAEKNGSVGGAIVNRSRYTKGEWFNANTKDGDEVAAPFVQAFTDAGLVVGSYLVANDTPLTMKAIATADAGMVASTGVNATLVDTVAGQRMIFNAEIGTSCKMPTSLLSQGDLITANTPARVIEHLLSGKFLPLTFVGHISALARAGAAALTPLATHLDSLGENAFALFGAEDLTALLYRVERFRDQHRNVPGMTDEAIRNLTDLSARLVVRSAQLSALIALASVALQINEKRLLTVSLDSRLSREIPLFWKTLQETTERLTPSGAKVLLSLVDRREVSGGVLSVPMIGASNALDAIVR